MSTTRIFHCNLCCEMIDAALDDGAVALYFHSPTTLGGRFEFTHVTAADGAHLCGKCMQQLQELFGKERATQ